MDEDPRIGTPIPQQVDGRHEDVDWTDLSEEMWSFLTGRQSAINYRFIDLAVEVPQDTGPEAARATWRVNGLLQVSTRDPERDDNTNGSADPKVER